jgi:aryl carrier-like protein
VADCAVAVDASGPSPRLVAYVVPVEAGAPVPDTLDRHAREQLHAAMVPGLYLALDRLPLSRTGKLDRSALPAPAEVLARQSAATPAEPAAGSLAMTATTTTTATTTASAASAATGPFTASEPADPPRTPTERRLAETWAALLDRPVLDRRDRVFDLGGDSLLASRAVARVRAWAGAEVKVADLYETPELAAFAALLDARRIRPGAGPAVPSVPLTRRARVAL